MKNHVITFLNLKLKSKRWIFELYGHIPHFTSLTFVKICKLLFLIENILNFWSLKSFIVWGEVGVSKVINYWLYEAEEERLVIG